MTTALVAGALALTACTGPDATGGDPTAAPASPQEQVTALLTQINTSSDPDLCASAYTDRALEQSLGTADVEACREAVARVVPADEVAVEDVVVRGDTATARVTLVGGDNAGYAQGVELVRTQDGWRYDRYTSLEIADRAAVDAALARLVQQNGSTLMTPAQITCVQGRLTAVPDAQLEAVQSDGSLQTVLVDGIRDCVGGGVDLAAIALLSSYQLVQAGLTQAQADCVAAAGILDYGELGLADIVTDPAARRQWQDALVTAAEYGADDVGADSSICAKAGQ